MTELFFFISDTNGNAITFSTGMSARQKQPSLFVLALQTRVIHLYRTRIGQKRVVELSPLGGEEKWRKLRRLVNSYVTTKVMTYGIVCAVDFSLLKSNFLNPYTNPYSARHPCTFSRYFITGYRVHTFVSPGRGSFSRRPVAPLLRKSRPYFVATSIRRGCSSV